MEGETVWMDGLDEARGAEECEKESGELYGRKKRGVAQRSPRLLVKSKSH